jgi:hypothetical protein
MMLSVKFLVWVLGGLYWVVMSEVVGQAYFEHEGLIGEYSIEMHCECLLAFSSAFQYQQVS